VKPKTSRMEKEFDSDWPTALAEMQAWIQGVVLENQQPGRIEVCISGPLAVAAQSKDQESFVVKYKRWRDLLQKKHGESLKIRGDETLPKHHVRIVFQESSR